MSTKPAVLTVGNCAYDHGNLEKLLKQHFEGNTIRATTKLEAYQHLEKNQQPIHLVLVNRVFDSDGDSGLDFIQDLRTKANYKNIPVMLISNFAEAQEEAVKRGAISGFGKADLGTKPMIEKLNKVLVAS